MSSAKHRARHLFSTVLRLTSVPFAIVRRSRKSVSGGGPLFTNAILDVLDRFGDHFINNELGYGASPLGILGASKHRVHRIAKRIPELKGTCWDPKQPGKSPAWSDEAIVELLSRKP